MFLSKRKVGQKVKGFSLIESLISLSIISIIITVFVIGLTNHFNIGKDISMFKLRMTMDLIKIELKKNNEPLESIIENSKLDNQSVDFSINKINDSTYKLSINVSSRSHKGNINEVLIIHNYINDF